MSNQNNLQAFQDEIEVREKINKESKLSEYIDKKEKSSHLICHMRLESQIHNNLFVYFVGVTTNLLLDHGIGC